MKSFFSLFLAAFLGSLLTVGLLLAFLPKPVSPEAPNAFNAKEQLVKLESSSSVLAVPDFRDAARTATPAVVNISALVNRTGQGSVDPFRFFFGEESPYGGNKPAQGTGSGVIYTSDGYIITNNHVVANAERIEVTLTNNKRYSAEIVGTDEKSDIAVLKIEGNSFPTLDLADSDAAEIGEWVLAIGNPLELNSTVTAGIISAKGRSINLLGGGAAIEAFIQTDAAVNPGNSGGALVDAKGNLLGINTAIATRTGLYAGYSFAIPVNLVKKIADDIIRYGSFQRAFLGINIFELDAEYAQEKGLGITQGVVIEQILEGGSAEFSGLQKDDIIVGVNGTPIRSVPELQERIGRSQVGDEVELEVIRNGQKQAISVVLRAN